MCSTFKGYAAAAVLSRADGGLLALTDTVTIAPSELVTYSPVTEPRVGQPMTLAELCQAAVQQSDNSAANALLRVLGGPPAITEFARSIGDAAGPLGDGVELGRAGRSPRHQHAGGVGHRLPRTVGRRRVGRVEPPDSAGLDASQ